jgi:hypothetical protein
MVCQRCRGLLVCETFDDLSIETDSRYTATRCINSGCIEDAVIHSNRFCRLESARGVPRRSRMVRKGEVILNRNSPYE